MNYKDKARLYFKAVNDYDQPSVESLVREDYIQHNPYLPTGRSAFTAILPILKKHQSKIKNKRIIQDGSHVVMHHQWKNAEPFGANELVAFHIIRFDQEGLIAEHWNVISETDSAERLIEGESEIESYERIAEYKDVIRNMGSDLRSGNLKAIERYFHEKFISHQEEGVTSLDGYLKKLANSFIYTEQHKIFGEGNFVISISEGLLNGKNTAIYDLFRFVGQKVKEHWNVSQKIPDKNIANSNGMFGFNLG